MGTDGQPPLKRGLSSTMSLGTVASEIPAPEKPAQPQDSPNLQINRVDSMTSLAGDSIDVQSKDSELQPHRIKVKQKLLEALGKEEAIEAKDGQEEAGTEEKM